MLARCSAARDWVIILCTKLFSSFIPLISITSARATPKSSTIPCAPPTATIFAGFPEMYLLTAVILRLEHMQALLQHANALVRLLVVKAMFSTVCFLAARTTSTGELPRSNPGRVTPFRSPARTYPFFLNPRASRIVVTVRTSWKPCASAVTTVLDALKTSIITQYSRLRVLFTPFTPWVILQLPKGISSQAPP